MNNNKKIIKKLRWNNLWNFTINISYLMFLNIFFVYFFGGLDYWVFRPLLRLFCSPIYDFWGMSGFEPRVLPNPESALPTKPPIPLLSNPSREKMSMTIQVNKTEWFNCNLFVYSFIDVKIILQTKKLHQKIGFFFNENKDPGIGLLDSFQISQQIKIPSSITKNIFLTAYQ